MWNPTDSIMEEIEVFLNLLSLSKMYVLYMPQPRTFKLRTNKHLQHQIMYNNENDIMIAKLDVDFICAKSLIETQTSKVLLKCFP